MKCARSRAVTVALVVDRQNEPSWWLGAADNGGARRLWGFRQSWSGSWCRSRLQRWHVGDPGASAEWDQHSGCPPWRYLETRGQRLGIYQLPEPGRAEYSSSAPGVRSEREAHWEPRGRVPAGRQGGSYSATSTPAVAGRSVDSGPVTRSGPQYQSCQNRSHPTTELVLGNRCRQPCDSDRSRRRVFGHHDGGPGGLPVEFR